MHEIVGILIGTESGPALNGAWFKNMKDYFVRSFSARFLRSSLRFFRFAASCSSGVSELTPLTTGSGHTIGLQAPISTPDQHEHWRVRGVEMG